MSNRVTEKSWPADPDAWRPLACAVRDFLGGRTSATIDIESDDGVVQQTPVAVFAGGEEGASEAEECALRVCRGHVLDVGAGAGRHALALQAVGADVTAIDVSPELVDIMRTRGVRDARVADVFELTGRFDTLLFSMNGIGVVGTLEGLDRLLVHARTLVASGGQILLDSFDLRSSPDPRTTRAVARRETRGTYFGEVTFTLRYDGAAGKPYTWLFVDAETLARRSRAGGWHMQLLFEGEDTTFVARLVDARPGEV